MADLLPPELRGALEAIAGHLGRIDGRLTAIEGRLAKVEADVVDLKVQVARLDGRLPSFWQTLTLALAVIGTNIAFSGFILLQLSRGAP
jgi:hypothetical protein